MEDHYLAAAAAWLVQLPRLKAAAKDAHNVGYPKNCTHNHSTIELDGSDGTSEASTPIYSCDLSDLPTQRENPPPPRSPRLLTRETAQVRFLASPAFFIRFSVTGESSRRRFDSWPSLPTARAGGSRGGRPWGSETPISGRPRPSLRSPCAATFSCGRGLDRSPLPAVPPCAAARAASPGGGAPPPPPPAALQAPTLPALLPSPPPPSITRSGASVAGRGRQRQERAASACGGPQHLGFDVEAVLESSEAAADRFPPTAIFVLPLTPEVAKNPVPSCRHRHRRGRTRESRGFSGRCRGRSHAGAESSIPAGVDLCGDRAATRPAPPSGQSADSAEGSCSCRSQGSCSRFRFPSTTIDLTIGNIRETVKYVTGSTSRKEKFKLIAQQDYMNGIAHTSSYLPRRTGSIE
ncbi:proline-rich protein 36-like [Panicum virgatum]|uniref:proline-rich protein 36-like n=1 Tax=Panicum virgatum TaxID=38727 RepID=UPI0019D5282C|nr:proline-rich protein 36-like [Panicum virgatum]